MPGSRTNPSTRSVADVLARMGAALEAQGDGPLHDRLGAALRSAVREGRLPFGTRLPPSRLLAADLGVSRLPTTRRDLEGALAPKLREPIPAGRPAC